MFPNGWAGSGLLLMRALCALAAGAALWRLAPRPAWAVIAVVMLSVAILLGLRTRLTALTGAALSAYGLAWTAGGLNWVALLPLALLALAMTGPGAYSIDARLFGRRVITLGRPRVQPPGPHSADP
jgi:hypothetical protein